MATSQGVLAKPEARRGQEGTPPRASRTIREEIRIVVSHGVGGNLLGARKACQARCAVWRRPLAWEELLSSSLSHFFRHCPLLESRDSVLFPGVASPQWVLHQWQAGQEKELPFTPGLGCAGGCLRVVFHPPCVTGLWSMPSCQPPGLHGHWLPLAERALHTALTCQPCPPQGLLACMHRSCLWDELLPPTRIQGPWAGSVGSEWGGHDPLL